MKHWKILRADIAGKWFLIGDAYCEGKNSTYGGFKFDTLFCNEILIQREYIVSVIFTSVNRKGYAQQHVVFKLRLKYLSAHISRVIL